MPLEVTYKGGKAVTTTWPSGKITGPAAGPEAMPWIQHHHHNMTGRSQAVEEWLGCHIPQPHAQFAV